MPDYFRSEPHDEGEVWFSQEKIAALTAGARQRRQVLGSADRADNDRLWATFDEILKESVPEAERAWLALDFDDPVKRWVREYKPRLTAIRSVRDWIRSREADPFQRCSPRAGSGSHPPLRHDQYRLLAR
jgi:hypothetical protein